MGVSHERRVLPSLVSIAMDQHQHASTCAWRTDSNLTTVREVEPGAGGLSRPGTARVRTRGGPAGWRSPRRALATPTPCPRPPNRTSRAPRRPRRAGPRARPGARARSPRRRSRASLDDGSSPKVSCSWFSSALEERRGVDPEQAHRVVQLDGASSASAIAVMAVLVVDAERAASGRGVTLGQVVEAHDDRDRARDAAVARAAPAPRPPAWRAGRFDDLVDAGERRGEGLLVAEGLDRAGRTSTSRAVLAARVGDEGGGHGRRRRGRRASPRRRAARSRT